MAYRIAAVWLCWLLVAVPAWAADTDGDTIDDSVDNCICTPNQAQEDNDGDGYGDRCDPDFDNNMTVGSSDLNRLWVVFGQCTPTLTDTIVDMNNDGCVGAWEYAVLRDYFGGPPGPAAVPVVGGTVTMPGGDASGVYPQVASPSSECTQTCTGVCYTGSTLTGVRTNNP